MNLPKDIAQFALWWLVGAPKRIATICKRILILVNNEVSFFLNLKMLFVPLFGDYTIIGRLMGFIYRIVKIVLGMVLLVFLFILSLLLFFAWYLIPFYLFYSIKLWAFAFIGFLIVIWKVITRNVPTKRISHLKENEDIMKSFRPEVQHYVLALKKDKTTGISRLFNHPQMVSLVKRLELTDESFLTSLLTDTHSLDDLESKTFKYAKEQDTKYVEIEHILLGLLDSLEDSERYLAKYDLELENCLNTVNWIIGRREYLSSVLFWQEDYEVPVIGGVNRAMTGRITPALDAVSVDLTAQAQRGALKKITAHKEETQQMIEMLSSSDRVNALIIGPPGCGKSSIVKAIAQKIIKGTKEGALKFKRIVSIETGTLIAGASTAGEISQNIKKIMDDAEGSGDIILFFDEIHNLVLADGSDTGSTIFALLEPYFSAGKFQIIGATNLENYRKYLEPNGSFSRLFRVVEVNETNEEETIEVLENVAYNLESTYNVLISFPAIKNTYSFAKKLIHERVFPDKGIDILTRAALKAEREDRYITKSDIAQIVSDMTHVPVTAVTQDESEKLLNIESNLKKRVIGQDHAIDQIGGAMKRGRVGIRNEGKPIASFLFIGTTGVGKTETAKALADHYFGDEKAMIRLDMSEYQQKDSLSRLLGSPDGSSKGLLTEAVRKKPFSLILLDEIEKADSQVLLTFLQVLDDGRLTDSSGRTVDFSNTIIIATSNVGTRSIQQVSAQGGDFDQINEVAMKDVRDHYAPEFLNRFTGIIVYKPLDMNSVRKIAHLMLASVQRMADEKGIKIGFTPDLVERLIEKGYNPEWGARPLARVIEDDVETYLAVKILSKEFNKGDDVTLGVEVFEGNPS